MANLAKTELNVYSDSSGATQLGHTLTQISDATNVFVDYNGIGDDINPGEEYWVKVRVTDTLNRTSSWTPLSKVVTYPELQVTAAPDNMQTRVYIDAIYNSGVMEITNSGILMSTDPDGAGAQSFNVPIQEFVSIPLTEEDTDYYMVGWCDDTLGRHYVQPWGYAASVTSGFNEPTVNFMNVDPTTDMIYGILNISSTNQNIPLNGVWVLLYDDQDTLQNSIKLQNQLGMQAFGFQNGDTDYYGNTITINSDTDYKLVADVSYTVSTVRVDYYTHTAIDPTSNITITVNNVTSNSAYITWLVEGNSSLQPTVTLYVNGGGNWYYPQTEDDYGQWSIQLNGLQSGTTYTVYGEVEVAGQDIPGTDTKYFTTL